MTELSADEAVRDAVESNVSLAGVIRDLGGQPSTHSYRLLKDRIRHLGLSTDHMAGKGWACNCSFPKRARPLADYLRSDTPIRSSLLRRRLIPEGVKEQECELCRGRTWQGAPIPLELDHVNGDRNDNRLENLRLLCPNCHALTPTYRGRNIGRYATSSTRPDVD